jgi:hypothetical protein
MHPRRDLETLNRRKERDRRLRFINRRIGEILHEYRLVEGRATVLPSKMARPPEWALRAATQFLRSTFERPPDEIVAKNPLRAFGELKGMIEVMSAAAIEAAADTDSNTRRFAAKMLRLAQPERDVAATLANASVAAERLSGTSTKHRLEYQKSQVRGAEQVVSDDGSIRIPRTAQAEIYYVVWFFWEELNRKLPELSSGKLHRWLTQSLGIHASEKTVELVYTRLRLGKFVRASLAT